MTVILKDLEPVSLSAFPKELSLCVGAHLQLSGNSILINSILALTSWWYRTLRSARSERLGPSQIFLGQHTALQFPRFPGIFWSIQRPLWISHSPDFSLRFFITLFCFFMLLLQAPVILSNCHWFDLAHTLWRRLFMLNYLRVRSNKVLWMELFRELPENLPNGNFLGMGCFGSLKPFWTFNLILNFWFSYWLWLEDHQFSSLPHIWGKCNRNSAS